MNVIPETRHATSPLSHDQLVERWLITIREVPGLNPIGYIVFYAGKTCSKYYYSSKKNVGIKFSAHGAFRG
jgi:hypothetical protein